VVYLFARAYFFLSLFSLLGFESFPINKTVSTLSLNEKKRTRKTRLHDKYDTKTTIMGSSNESTMKVSKEEMKKAGIDLAYRDFCAHLLIPLNECRRKSFFLPWKCGDERHVYEKCQYEECVFRCCCFLLLSLLLLFFSRVYLSSLKERAFRVSFDVCFSRREREREKRDVFETRELTFLRLSRNTYRRYMKRVRKMKEQRGEE